MGLGTLSDDADMAKDDYGGAPPVAESNEPLAKMLLFVSPLDEGVAINGGVNSSTCKTGFKHSTIDNVDCIVRRLWTAPRVKNLLPKMRYSS
jgi:hypothetical protein